MKLHAIEQSIWLPKFPELPTPDNPKDCFRIVPPKVYRKPLEQGELLADANYWVHFNLSQMEKCLTGKELFTIMQSVLETTYIPWVLARCTIIPV